MQKDTTRFASAMSALSSRSGSPSKGGYAANGRRASRAAEDTAASGSRRGSEAGQAPVREGGAFAACCSMGAAVATGSRRHSGAPAYAPRPARPAATVRRPAERVRVFVRVRPPRPEETSGGLKMKTGGKGVVIYRE